MKIGILTGGGDVPGLNPAIKAVVNRVAEHGHTVLGIRRGWAGLLECDLDDPDSAARHVLALTPEGVRTVDRSGGTFLHTSRTNPSKVKAKDTPAFLKGQVEGDGAQDFTAHILKVLKHLHVDALVPIGGDDTLSYGLRLHDEGIPVVAIPKTMDNDVSGTDYCLGFATAVARSVEFITNLRTSTGSHERLAVVELFGRNSGETSLISAYLADADRAIISEVPFNPEKLASLLMDDRRRNPSKYAMVTISEGAQMVGGEVVERGQADAFGHKKLGGIGLITGEILKELTGVGIIQQQVGYLMRSGPPDPLDLMVAFNYGSLAADLLMGGTTGRMVALRGGAYTHVPMSETRAGARKVDVEAMYDVDGYRPRIRSIEGLPMFLR
ncbi:MAG: phosphofructokinase [Chloroflexi bacterium RBG_13_68_17]|nr:MAG: phosphofructokinase [Chloroflexi bacterium RBG_13_68_17]